MSTTATSYINRINSDYPVKGQDNDSQGFRDNFLNIKRGLNQINEDLEDLDKNTIKINTGTILFGNTIDDVNLKNYSKELYQLPSQSGYIEVDYTDGNYQSFTLASGDHEIAIVNWPDSSNKAGEIRLVVETQGISTLDFRDSESLGPETNPFGLDANQTYFFSCVKYGDSDTVFVKLDNGVQFTNSSTGTVAYFHTVHLGPYGDQSKHNIFNTNESSLSNLATVVARTTSTIRKGELALLPNRITTIVNTVTQSNPGWLTLYVNSTDGMVEGSTFTISHLTATNNTIFTVNTITSLTQMEIIPSNSDLLNYGAPSKNITVTNKFFDQQPRVTTLSETYANTFTGTYTNYKGSIYAEKVHLEVTYDDYGNSNDNTFVIKTLENKTDVTDISEAVVGANWVHNLLPFGSVIMWYGSKDDVPTGWKICDGQTYNTGTSLEITTPNLIDKFAIGASNDTTLGLPGSTATSVTTSTTGGYSDSIVVDHLHLTTSTSNTAGTPQGTIDNVVVDPGHSHTISGQSNDEAGAGKVAVGSSPPEGADPVTDGATTNISIESEFTGQQLPGHSHLVSVLSTGTSGTQRNIPPFTALYYIIKIIGFAYGTSL